MRMAKRSTDAPAIAEPDVPMTVTSALNAFVSGMLQGDEAQRKAAEQALDEEYKRSVIAENQAQVQKIMELLPYEKQKAYQELLKGAYALEAEAVNNAYTQQGFQWFSSLPPETQNEIISYYVQNKLDVFDARKKEAEAQEKALGLAKLRVESEINKKLLEDPQYLSLLANLEKQKATENISELEYKRQINELKSKALASVLESGDLSLSGMSAEDAHAFLRSALGIEEPFEKREQLAWEQTREDIRRKQEEQRLAQSRLQTVLSTVTQLLRLAVSGEGGTAGTGGTPLSQAKWEDPSQVIPDLLNPTRVLVQKKQAGLFQNAPNYFEVVSSIESIKSAASSAYSYLALRGTDAPNIEAPLRAQIRALIPRLSIEGELGRIAPAYDAARQTLILPEGVANLYGGRDVPTENITWGSGVNQAKLNGVKRVPVDRVIDTILSEARRATSTVSLLLDNGGLGASTQAGQRLDPEARNAILSLAESLIKANRDAVESDPQGGIILNLFDKVIDKVTGTQQNQPASPSGITPPSFSAPSVSPPVSVGGVSVSPGALPSALATSGATEQQTMSSAEAGINLLGQLAESGKATVLYHEAKDASTGKRVYFETTYGAPVGGYLPVLSQRVIPNLPPGKTVSPRPSYVLDSNQSALFGDVLALSHMLGDTSVASRVPKEEVTEILNTALNGIEGLAIKKASKDIALGLWKKSTDSLIPRDLQPYISSIVENRNTKTRYLVEDYDPQRKELYLVNQKEMEAYTKAMLDYEKTRKMPASPTRYAVTPEELKQDYTIEKKRAIPLDEWRASATKRTLDQYYFSQGAALFAATAKRLLSGPPIASSQDAVSRFLKEMKSYSPEDRVALAYFMNKKFRDAYLDYKINSENPEAYAKRMIRASITAMGGAGTTVQTEEYFKNQARIRPEIVQSLDSSKPEQMQAQAYGLNWFINRKGSSENLLLPVFKFFSSFDMSATRRDTSSGVKSSTEISVGGKKKPPAGGSAYDVISPADTLPEPEEETAPSEQPNEGSEPVGALPSQGSITPVSFTESVSPVLSAPLGSDGRKALLDTVSTLFSNYGWKVTIRNDTLAYRNNNPGNLKFARQKGARLGEKGFARFETPEDGFLALIKQINTDASRGLTLKSFLRKFTGDNTAAERNVQFLSERIPNVDENTPLYLINPLVLAEYMAFLESGTRLHREIGA
jgi:hypothetical protein